MLGYGGPSPPEATEPVLRRLQVGAVASQAGEQLAAVALAVYAYRVGGAAAVGLVGVVQMVPAAVLGPVAALAPAAAGVLLLAGSAAALLAVAALAFLVGAVVVRRVPPTDGVRTAPAMGTVLEALVQGLHAAVGDRGTALVLGVLLAHNTVRGAVGVLVVVLPVELLGWGSSGIGFATALVGLGGLLGAAGAATLAGRRSVTGPLAVGVVLTGLPLAVAAAVSTPPVVVAAVAVLGSGLTLVSVSGTTLLVRSVRDDVLARLLGVLGTVRAAGVALGAGLTPLLVAGVGLRAALAATGLGLLAVLLAAGRGLRALDRRSRVPVAELRLLQRAEVFAPLPPVALERLATRLERRSVDAGTAVVREGDVGDRVFLVAGGDIVVEASETGGVVDVLGRGEVFGEMALLHDARRNATVRAVGPVELYSLTREEFLVAVTGSPASAARASHLVAARLEHRRRASEPPG